MVEPAGEIGARGAAERAVPFLCACDGGRRGGWNEVMKSRGRERGTHKDVVLFGREQEARSAEKLMTRENGQGAHLERRGVIVGARVGSELARLLHDALYGYTRGRNNSSARFNKPQSCRTEGHRRTRIVLVQGARDRHRVYLSTT